MARLLATDLRNGHLGTIHLLRRRPRGLVRHYEADGWQVRQEGPVLRAVGLETLANPESA
jgi:hypothetical protein